MRVLFDHNVPKKLRGLLPDHEIVTCQEMGWDTLKNGELIAAAEREGFAAMVTADKNLTYQQNLEGRVLSLVVLSTNAWPIIQLAPELVSRALEAMTPGSFHYVVFAIAP